jgi:hypothetical protein
LPKRRAWARSVGRDVDGFTRFFNALRGIVPLTAATPRRPLRGSGRPIQSEPV